MLDIIEFWILVTPSLNEKESTSIAQTPQC
jgi:hypothetical protein